MHFHLPKPLHGWREFAGEVGIIVIGVLIALGAEQVVESSHDRLQVEKMRSRLGSELSNNLINVYERLAIDRCLTGRIAELRGLLVKSNGTWTGQPANFGKYYVNVMPAVYRIPNRPWPTSEWQAAKASGIVNKASDAQSSRYSGLYTYIDELDATQKQERDYEAELGDLAFDTHLSDADRNEHLRTLSRLDDLNSRFINIAENMVDGAANIGVTLSAQDQASTLKLDRSFRGACVTAPHLTPVSG
jgi:hypothetical protein